MEEILAAAKRLIGEKGIDGVKMREIAAFAGGPISSVYQYFPNKSAIIATLFQQWTEEIEAAIGGRAAEVADLDGLQQSASDMLDYFFERVHSDPAILDLINAVQADKALLNLDIESTRRQTNSFCEAGLPFVPASRHEDFRRVAFLMFQLTAGAVRLALSDGQDSGNVLEDYKTIIRGQISLFTMPE
ncbi:TetR/AcrR family transcriptional regulator [Rhizobium sp. LjRoot254]|uniref:TetR/AcrR family transcriptional regulator n=1 Tax=Rhizobium sp. LjRoot254 TaxID=3342297 RepID=UPI003ECEE060